MRVALVIINLIALVFSTIWWISNPDWEPAVSTIVLLGTLLGQILGSENTRKQLRIKVRSGKNSTNIQSDGGDVSVLDQSTTIINKGISYNDAKEIAIDVYRANMMKFRAEAETEATLRMELITEQILTKIYEMNPEMLTSFRRPDMQQILFLAQKKYAISGEDEILEILVEIILERVKSDKRNLLQLVIDESIIIASKLSVEHLNLLTLSFLIKNAKFINLSNLDQLVEVFKESILPFIPDDMPEIDHYRYLKYMGCGELLESVVHVSLGETLFDTYQVSLARDGWVQLLRKSKHGDKYLDELGHLLLPVDGGPYLGHIDDEEERDNLDRFLYRFDVDYYRNKPRMLSSYSPSMRLMMEQLKEISYKVSDFNRSWDEDSFVNFKLTSVGIALAIANYKRVIGNNVDLSIWIN